MYKIILVFLFFNFSFSQTQIELNFKVKKQYDLIFNELNILQNKILYLNKHNKQIQNKIISSQKIWIKQCDSYMNRKYPLNQRKDYGTYFPVRWYNELIMLTKNRIKYLKKTYLINY